MAAVTFHILSLTMFQCLADHGKKIFLHAKTIIWMGSQEHHRTTIPWEWKFLSWIHIPREVSISISWVCEFRLNTGISRVVNISEHDKCVNYLGDIFTSSSHGLRVSSNMTSNPKSSWQQDLDNVVDGSKDITVSNTDWVRCSSGGKKQIL